MEISGSISRVWTRIHPNPICLESLVGKTLVRIREVWIVWILSLWCFETCLGGRKLT